MYITVDDIKIELSLYYPIDNRNGNKKVGLIRAYFVYSFYNVEKDEKIHLKNGETLPVKKGHVIEHRFITLLPNDLVIFGT